MDIHSDTFISYLRSALNHLYEPNQLRRSPLAALLGLAGRVDTPVALQKVLIEAIEQLKPGDDDPSNSRAWLIHDVLFLRYVRGYSREAVSSQLGISDRQLSRDQRAAIDALSLYLWKTYNLEDRAQSPFPAAPGGGQPGAEEGDSSTTRLPPVSEEARELSWRENLPAERTSLWKPVLQSVLELLHPLVREHNVQLHYHPAADAPDLLIAQNALRQSLLILLGWMIPLSRQGELTLLPSVHGNEFILKACAALPGGEGLSAVFDRELPPRIAAARQLLELAGGSIDLECSPFQARFSLSLPALAQVPVLVIDDNLDTIHLFERYAQGTRYALAGVTEPGDIPRLVEKYKPKIILLDVMMPETDGWDILTQLRHCLKNQPVSIVICSIMPMEGLARSLGANGFLQKPVLPLDFLRKLDEQVEQFSTGIPTGNETTHDNLSIE